MGNVFDHSTYLARRKVLSVLGQKFHIFDPNGQVVCFVNQKAFKLKEDIRVYADESMGSELLVISARSVLDISATYDVTDGRTKQKVGALRRKGLKSILKDEWLILDPMDREIGLIQEDSALMAALRRVINLIPQHFSFWIGGQQVGEARQQFNPFVFRMDVDFSRDPGGQRLDRRLGLAAVILLLAIEGRQG